MVEEAKKVEKTLFDKIKEYCKEESNPDVKNGEEKSSIVFKRGGEKCEDAEQTKLIKK